MSAPERSSFACLVRETALNEISLGRHLFRFWVFVDGRAEGLVAEGGAAGVPRTRENLRDAGETGLQLERRGRKIVC